MKIVNIQDEKVGLNELIKIAREEPVLILTENSEEFILSPADDFEQEADSLRKSASFQSFLDERSQCKTRIPLSEIEKEIDKELLKG